MWLDIPKLFIFFSPPISVLFCVNAFSQSLWTRLRLWSRYSEGLEEWAVVARVASNQGQKPVEDHPEGAVQRAGGHQEGTPVFVGGTQRVEQSPVMGGGWSGVGGLAHSRYQPSPSGPQKFILGQEEGVKKRNTRTEGQVSSDCYCW